jgi:hypothetical protein
MKSRDFKIHASNSVEPATSKWGKGVPGKGGKTQNFAFVEENNKEKESK